MVGKPLALGPRSSAAAREGAGAAAIGAGTTVGAGAVVRGRARPSATRCVVADQAHVRERDRDRGRVGGGPRRVGGERRARGRAGAHADRRLRDGVVGRGGRRLHRAGRDLSRTTRPRDARPADVELRGPTLRRGCRIGAGAVLLPGVEVGEDAFVARGRRGHPRRAGRRARHGRARPRGVRGGREAPRGAAPLAPGPGHAGLGGAAAGSGRGRGRSWSCGVGARPPAETGPPAGRRGGRGRDRAGGARATGRCRRARTRCSTCSRRSPPRSSWCARSPTCCGAAELRAVPQPARRPAAHPSLRAGDRDRVRRRRRRDPHPRRAARADPRGARSGWAWG